MTKPKAKRGLPVLTKAERIELCELRLTAFSSALDFARKGFANMAAIPPGEREELFKLAEFLNLVERNVNRRKSEARHAI